MTEKTPSAGLEVVGLRAGYGHRIVVDSVNLSVAPGECVAVIGSNGAGKSTLIKAISGLLRPVAGGTITLDGRPIDALAPNAIVRLGVRLVPEGRRLFPNLTVYENVELGGFTLRGRAKRAEMTERMLARFPRLAERRKQLVGTLSGGERQMAAIARALMTEPRYLLLDEPSLGLSPLILREVAQVVDEVRLAGTGVVLVEQNIGLAERLASRYSLLDRGRIARSGDASELAGGDSVASTYLGQGMIAEEADGDDA